MKQNRIFDQNSSQKARSWHYNMDTNRAEAQFADGSAIAIDCLAIEDEYGNTPAQRAELDWLLYNKPLECVQLVLSGEIEHYLSLPSFAVWTASGGGLPSLGAGRRQIRSVPVSGKLSSLGPYWPEVGAV